MYRLCVYGACVRVRARARVGVIVCGLGCILMCGDECIECV